MLFAAIARRVGPAAGELDRCGVAMFCWNFAYAGLRRLDVYEVTALDTLRPERLAEHAPRDVSAIAFAFASARVWHGPMFEALARHTRGLLRDCQELKGGNNDNNIHNDNDINNNDNSNNN